MTRAPSKSGGLDVEKMMGLKTEARRKLGIKSCRNSKARTYSPPSLRQAVTGRASESAKLMMARSSLRQNVTAVSNPISNSSNSLGCMVSSV